MVRAVLLATLVGAVTLSAAPQPSVVNKVTTEHQCPADLGKGVRSKRPFCDIAITTDPAKGDAMRIPPHKGDTTLRFDLHNRFSVNGETLPFQRITALVAVVNGNSGAVVGHAAVTGELRRELDLFDRIIGTGPGGEKGVAPGRAESVKLAVPAAVTSLSIVGVRVELTTETGTEMFATPGRPVAIVSNLRLDYVPATVGKQP
jgi:hypothetical protein